MSGNGMADILISGGFCDIDFGERAHKLKRAKRGRTRRDIRRLQNGGKQGNGVSGTGANGTWLVPVAKLRELRIRPGPGESSCVAMAFCRPSGHARQANPWAQAPKGRSSKAQGSRS